MRSQVTGQKSLVTNFIILFSLLIMVYGLCGCEAFVRKFTRKPKIEDLPKEEMVLSPEEYQAPNLSKEELYRQYLLYWKTWQGEMVDSLTLNGNHKKQVSCAQETIKNLELLGEMLDDTSRKKIDAYLFSLNELKESVRKDIYGNKISQNRGEAERLRMLILRDFSYAKIKDNLK